MKKTYKIEVDCANCAAKMERAASNIDGVNSVSISFLTQKITVDADDANFDELMREVDRVCKKIERDCVIHIV